MFCRYVFIGSNNNGNNINNSNQSLCLSAGFYELLVALPSQLQPHVIQPEDNTFLKDMFGERSLHSLIKVKEIYTCSCCN